LLKVRKPAEFLPGSRVNGFPGAIPLVAMMVIVAVSGCSEKPTAAIGEIRGEPINAALRANGSGPGATQARNSAISNSIGTGTTSAASGYPLIGFDRLSAFKFEPGEDLLNPQTNRVAGQSLSADAMIPANVKAFDQKKASIRGFMLPLKVEGGVVTELLIMRDQSMCCYGVVPKINEWISVKMQSKGVKAIMDQPVTLYGTLHVGEMRESGYLVGIYQFDGERMELPPD